MQNNRPPPLMDSATPSSLYSSHPPYLYSDSHYSLYYPQSQTPNPNLDLQQSYPTNSHNSVLQPPGVDSHQSLSANPYSNASSLHDTHQLGLYYNYPQAVQSGPAATYYQDPNAAHLAYNPYSNGITMQPMVADKLVTAKPNAASRAKKSIGLQKTMSFKKAPKQVKVVQSAWCEVCKVDCNSKNVLDQHKLGRKHKKNLEKLMAPSVQISAPVPTPTPTPAPTPAPSQAPVPISESATVPSTASAASDNTLIGPQENPDNPKSTSKNKAKKKGEDLETKKKKMLEGGAAAEAVRLCDICNVVCNSETVFRFHLAGQKHAAMLKKQATTTASAATCATTSSETAVTETAIIS